MNRKLRNTWIAMASSAMTLCAVIALSSIRMPDAAAATGSGASTSQARHGLAMPFFSFRPRS